MRRAADKKIQKKFIPCKVEIANGAEGVKVFFHVSGSDTGSNL
jgi:hypothetical protein